MFLKAKKKKKKKSQYIVPVDAIDASIDVMAIDSWKRNKKRQLV